MTTHILNILKTKNPCSSSFNCFKCFNCFRRSVSPANKGKNGPKYDFIGGKYDLFGVNYDFSGANYDFSGANYDFSGECNSAIHSIGIEANIYRIYRDSHDIYFRANYDFSGANYDFLGERIISSQKEWMAFG